MSLRAMSELTCADLEVGELVSTWPTRLLAWFDHAGRKHLPWQQQRTPYRVWISEVMLQQTQVSTVIPYFERFMARFSQVGQLADAPLDEVLHLWTGLGYYARARNMHKAARAVVDRHGGQFPLQLDEVQALPGIGRSTAGAILAQACGQRHPILDGNVKRVLTRAFGIHGDPSSKLVETRLWQLATQLTPHERVADYTQAMMDLGATVCVRSRPRCQQCPFVRECVAHRDGLQAQLPTPKAKRVRPHKHQIALVACDTRGRLLLEKRPPVGIWGGLWVCPQFDNDAALQSWMSDHLVSASSGNALPAIDHAFTHFDLHLALHHVRVAQWRDAVADVSRYCWYDPRSPERVGLARPVLTVLDHLQEKT